MKATTYQMQENYSEKLTRWMERGVGVYANRKELEYVLLSTLAAECGSEAVVREWATTELMYNEITVVDESLALEELRVFKQLLHLIRIPASLAAEFRAAHKPKPRRMQCEGVGTCSKLCPP